MSGPISPDDIAQGEQSFIPAFVFDVFNEMIATSFVDEKAIVKQEDVVQRLVSMGHSRREAFDRGYLNVEYAYRARGWIVEYEKPAYNESGSATFTFRRKA